MDDLIVEFLTETNESLSALDNDLIRLEQNPNDHDLLSNIFRLMHTIKGTCGFLGLPRLETVAHRAENVLGRFRDGDLQVTPAYVSLILESLDRVRYLLAELEMNGHEPEGNDSDLTARLDAVYEGRDGGGDAGSSAPTPAQAPPPEPEPEPEHATEHADDDVAAAASDTPVPPDASPSTGDNTAMTVAGVGKDTKESAIANQSLRVNVDVLENLMTMVSELVLTRNQLLQTVRSRKDNDEISGPLQRLNHVVSDLQEGVMKTRMQPIGSAWSKLPRIVRDLAKELGKKIDLKMDGEETELDRQVLDMIKDPLTHMVRNSADHGIEQPADRLKSGKPEQGTIVLRAYHEGGHIIIEIEDDGKGLPMDKIRKKIIANGLATEAELDGMTDQQIQQYIFRAGFSTAEKVTSVSGRGVGMDVVRTNIEKIGGSVEMKSAEGKGSTFTIKIPLTLAIVNALILGSAGERFAIPQLAVRELVLTGMGGDNRIELINGTPLFRLRNKLLPLISLEQVLNLHGNHAGAAGLIQSLNESKKYIVVTQVGGYQFGIIVDRVYDTEEIVVKPVSKIIKNIYLFSGNTILGDGSVIMILDPVGITKTMGQVDLSNASGAKDGYDTSAQGQKTSLLLFHAGNGAPLAVPLSLIARLEQIKTTKIENAGGRMLIQYRNQLMPLLPFNSDVDMTQKEKAVLVFADRNNSLGIVVDQIVDIIETTLDLQLNSTRPGFIGSTVIVGKATDIIDVAYYLHQMDQNWFKNHDDQAFYTAKNVAQDLKRRLLLVDDSPFFRNMLQPILSIAGYEVTVMDSAVKALQLCENGADFDIIVSDIEMPEMDGLEFVKRVKGGSRWAGTPVVALTSHATPQDIEHGYQMGFNKYVAKFDRETLLSTLTDALSEKGVAA